jgi:hypothetical protein
MRTIDKFAHAQRLINNAYQKIENMKTWYFSPFEKTSYEIEVDKLNKVINRLYIYSLNQQKQIG